MPDTEFDLGEALGGYEQAQADRNFYLSMVQGGTQMASPIAAYLAGVSGVKMANMRAKAQAIEDKRTAEKDALAATEKAQKRAMDLDNQIINIMKGARDGSIAPSAAAGMLGYVMKERGYIPKGYDADNNIMKYGIPGDEKDYQFDLGESETSKSQRDWYKLQLAKEKEERQARQGERSLNIQQQRANTYRDRTAGAPSNKYASYASFKASNPKAFALVSGDLMLEEPTRSDIEALIAGSESLAPKDRELAEKNVIPVVLDWVQTNHKDWFPFSNSLKDSGNPYLSQSDDELLNNAPR